MKESREIFTLDKKLEKREGTIKREGILPEKIAYYRKEYPELYTILDNIDCEFLKKTYSAHTEKVQHANRNNKFS
jgi:hypothetical protein